MATEQQPKYNRLAIDFPLQSPGNPRVFKNQASGTYTNTYTKYNKSHKSEERDFSKNTPQRIGAILRGSPDPEAVHNSTTVQDMFKIWQEEFPDSNERLNIRSASWLKAAYDSSFNGDLRAWRNYLRKAKTSEFIMDRPHLLRLKWLLRFETIGNISRGAYDVTAPAPDMAEVETQRNAMSAEPVRQIEELDEPEICKKQRRKILSKIRMELDDQKFRCHGSRFVVDCVSTRYRDLLELESENPTPAEKVVEVGPLPDFQAIRRENFSKSCHG